MATSVAERSRRSAATAGAAGLVAGAAFAILQILGQTISAWHPRPLVSAAIVVAAFFAGLWAAGWRTRRSAAEQVRARKRHLHNLLGAWPAPNVAGADPLRLGVFPARRDLGTEVEYVSRTIDSGLRAAIAPGAVVLICGEARAGTSRTAFEAARSRLPNAVLLAPRAPGSVLELLALEPELDLNEQSALVWLDGLDRFVDVLDAECLCRLRSLSEQVCVVASIRNDDWKTWLGGTGAQGEAARALLADAQVFELAAKLDDEELERARSIFPGLELSKGIAEAVASGGRESAPPLKRDPEPSTYSESNRSPKAWRDLQFALPGLATVGIVAILIAYLALVGFKTPPISDQLSAGEREGSQHGRHAALVMKADLHGNGVQSWFVVYSDNSATRTRSDTVEIYDEHGETLKRAFRFQPQNITAAFALRSSADVDFDGAQEIIGGYRYADESNGRGAMVPFAIDWDRAHDQYQIVSLSQRPPRLRTALLAHSDGKAPAVSDKAVKSAERNYRKLYLERTIFSDRPDQVTLRGYRVQDFAVSGAPHRLIVGWFLRPWLAKQPAKFELETAILDAHTGAPHLTRCTLSHLHNALDVSIGLDREASKVFEEVYAKVPTNRACLPQ